MIAFTTLFTYKLELHYHAFFFAIDITIEVPPTAKPVLAENGKVSKSTVEETAATSANKNDCRRPSLLSFERDERRGQGFHGIESFEGDTEGNETQSSACPCKEGSLVCKMVPRNAACIRKRDDSERARPAQHGTVEVDLTALLSHDSKMEDRWMLQNGRSDVRIHRPTNSDNLIIVECRQGEIRNFRALKSFTATNSSFDFPTCRLLELWNIQSLFLCSWELRLWWLQMNQMKL
ncbi:hypothetical protein MMC12_003629 [Toensbergia leucococca]|nr:hypothetical protein [Toensbergia leucococca]